MAHHRSSFWKAWFTNLPSGDRFIQGVHYTGADESPLLAHLFKKVLISYVSFDLLPQFLKHGEGLIVRDPMDLVDRTADVSGNPDVDSFKRFVEVVCDFDCPPKPLLRLPVVDGLRF